MQPLTSSSVSISLRISIILSLLLYGHDRVGTSAFAADALGSNLGLAMNCSANASVSDSSVGGFISEERRLLLCLMRGYDPAVRPAAEPGDKVNVILNNQLLTVTDLIEKDNILITENWFRQVWRDIQLRWKPEDFGGVKEIMIPVERIWTPKIVLFNNAGDTFGYVMGDLAIVEYTGNVTWVPHIRMKSYCDLDLSNFPYDQQNCSLTFGTWTYDKSLVDISLPREQNANFYYDQGAEWSVTDYRVFMYEYVDTQHTPVRYYPSAVYSLKLQRNSAYYDFILVHPTRALTVLTLLLFLLPHETKQRFMLAGAILICLTILLLVLETFLPTHISSQPVIASYLAYNSVFVLIVIKVSMITASFQYKKPGCAPVPNYLKWSLLGKLSRILCVSKSQYTTVPSLNVEENDLQRELQDRFTPSNGPHYWRTPKHDTHCHQGSEEEPTLRPGTQQSLEDTLEDVRRYLKVLTAQQQQLNECGTSHRQLVVEEWRQLGEVVDRLLFLTFSIITVIVLIAISLRAH